MANCDTRQELHELVVSLNELSDPIGWLCTAYARPNAYYTSSEHTNDVHARTKRFAEFANLTYIYAVLDSAGFFPTNIWLPKKYQEEYMAWVHVRHTGAHKPFGRAGRYRQEFDNFMTATGSSQSGLKENCSLDNGMISLPYGMAHKFFIFAKTMAFESHAACLSSSV